jgi:hypothetical protein
MLRLAPWYLHVLHPYAAGFLQRLPVLRLLAVHCAFRLGKRITPVKTGGYPYLVEAAGIEPASASPLPAALHA